MSELFSRNKLIWGSDNQELLSKKHVAVFGLGGVGGFTAESLARSGVGELTLLDFDTVSESNINRQLIALQSTMGKKKVLLFEQRLKDINPDIKLNIYDDFYTKELNKRVFERKPDFVVDAIDTLKSKIELLEFCYINKIPVITSMGAGNRLDPTKLEIKDISEIKDTKCKFVKNILRMLDKKNIKLGIKTVISSEAPLCRSHIKNEEKVETKDLGVIEFTKISPGSVSMVPAVAGYYMTFYIIKTFLKRE